MTNEEFEELITDLKSTLFRKPTVDNNRIFDLLEKLTANLKTRGAVELSHNLKAGFARGTGGVDEDYIVDSIVTAICKDPQPLQTGLLKTVIDDIVNQIRYPDFILPQSMPKPEDTTNFFGRPKPTIITPELERWAGAVALNLLKETLTHILKSVDNQKD